MTRHFKIGLLVAVVVAIAVTIIGLSSWNKSPGLFTLILTLPALPFVYALVQIYPPPMGESEISPWDNLMLAVAVIVSAVIWGFVAGLLSKHVFSRRKNAA